MNATTPHSLTRLLAGLAVLLFADGIAAAQGPAPSLDSILKGWQKRQQRIKRIRYTVVGESIVPKGSRTDDMGRPLPDHPPRDIAQKQNVTFLLDMAKQRFRMELEETAFLESEQALSPRVSICAFDGRDMMSAMPRDKNTSSVHTPRAARPGLCNVQRL